MSEHPSYRAPRGGLAPAARDLAQLRLRHLRRPGHGAGVRRRRVGVAGRAPAGLHGRHGEMFAGALSMGLGAFLGTRAERDLYQRERAREEREVQRGAAPRARRAARDLSQEGFRGRDARARGRDAHREPEALGQHHDVRGARAAAGRDLAVGGGRHGGRVVRAWRRRCRCCPICFSRARARCSRRSRSPAWRCSASASAKSRFTQRPALRAARSRRC